MKNSPYRFAAGILLTWLLLAAGSNLHGQPVAFKFDRYHTPDEMARFVKELKAANPGAVKLHLLAKGYEGIECTLVEIGKEIDSEKKTKPAVLVVADMEGTAPLAMEASVYLIRELLGKPDLYRDVTWYVLPCGNPAGAGRYFSKPLLFDGRNFRPWNDDMDEQTDEDSPEDLNGDGLITQMRVKDPDGTMVPDEKEPRLLRRADPAKGEQGVFKVYTEGIDNDGDGQYNEDGKGGTNIGITFPHLFGYNQPGTGAWPGSEPEVFSLMKFVTDHPEIAMTMTYGSTNFCLVPPKAGRKSAMNLSAIKIPQRYAQMLNADPDKTYTLEEVKELLKAIVPPGTPVDDSMVASMLDMGAVVNPLEADLKIYQALSEKYKQYLKDKGYTAKRLDPARDKDGSFELWAYYQLGLPSFSMDFWGLPEVIQDTVKGKAEGRGQEGKSKDESAKKEETRDPMMEAFLAYNDKELGGKGFVPWTEVDHPAFGKVEVGGVVPFADLIPEPEKIDSLLTVQVPWIFELVKQIPVLAIEEVKTEPQGAGIFRVTAWIRNTKQFHFPLAMGSRNKVPPPAVVILKGKNIVFISGRQRTPLEGLNASEQRKFTWIIQAENPSEINISVNPVNAFGSEKTVKLGGN